MSYRARPSQIHHQVKNLLKGGLLKEQPAWYPAVRLIPPGPSIVFSHQAQDFLGEGKSHGPTTKTRTHHQQKHLRTRKPRPQPIIYPEDRLRHRFFRDHPFELHRPRVLIEGEGTNRNDWSSLLAPGMHPSEITGECVIQYQLHLMRHKGLTEQQAYAQACSEFYAIRAMEETEQKVAEEQARAFGAVFTERPTVKKGLLLEEKILKEAEAIAMRRVGL
ncbi:mitochondrial 37S ribosomal protein mS23 [Calcarisporiella thermophila]|uniref:mitochondrial 37S ribosomal protein mS23 n=1 Tax=Calcarisporiella thermophila TaxID=911321 RepID=UPI0037427AEA